MILFERVTAILDEARHATVRAVNNQMVLAYWHIGREIIASLQGGDERAEYGHRLIDSLSARLPERYGRGFSTTNLRYFRTFYQVFAERIPEIRHIAGGESPRARLATRRVARKDSGTLRVMTE